MEGRRKVERLMDIRIEWLFSKKEFKKEEIRQWIANP